MTYILMTVKKVQGIPKWFAYCDAKKQGHSWVCYGNGDSAQQFSRERAEKKARKLDVPVEIMSFKEGVELIQEQSTIGGRYE